jgi:hypothetical protein
MHTNSGIQRETERRVTEREGGKHRHTERHICTHTYTKILRQAYKGITHRHIHLQDLWLIPLSLVLNMCSHLIQA